MTISVVIPSYNCAALLPRAIESVLAQSRPADELIVVDDGSTDDTAAACGAFGSAVRYVQRPNGGLAAARNTGIAASTGDWFLFLDADDTLYSHALATLAATARTGEAGVVYGFVLQRRASPLETRLHSLPYAAGSPPQPAKAQFWWTAISTAGCALISRSLNEEAGGFDENFRQVEDCEYWLRCGVLASFAHCDQIVLDKTFSTSSLGQQTDGSIWYRLQLQLKFLVWSRRRGIDTGFLQTSPAAVIEHALIRIHRERAWNVLEPVLRHARREKLRSPWVLRSMIRHALLKASGRLPRDSQRYQDVYLGGPADNSPRAATPSP